MNAANRPREIKRLVKSILPTLSVALLSIQLLVGQSGPQAKRAAGPGVTAKQGLTCKTPGLWELQPDGSAYTCFHTEAGSRQPGELQVTATGGATVLDFQIVYISDQKPGIGFRQNWDGGPPVVKCPPGAACNPGLITQAIQTFRHHKPWVEMALAIDNQASVKVTSENERTNYAHLRFLMGANPTRTLSGVNDVLTAGLSNNSLDRVLKARVISLELTTESGATQTLEIKPQEPSFQKFASRCNFLGYTPTIHETSGDGFNLLLSIPLKDRNLQGTTQAFVTQFPGFMNRAAAASGLPPRSYEKEIAFITDAVKTCSTITPDMAKPLFVPTAGMRRITTGAGQVVTMPAGTEDISKLGAQYDACRPNKSTNVSQQVGSTAVGSRAIQLVISPGLWVNPSNMWQDGGGFRVEVFFESQKGDPLPHGLSYPAPSDYRIISALINPQDLAGGRAATPAQPIQRMPESSTQTPSTSAIDGFRPLGASIPIADRQFSGTAEGFATALPGFVRRAASASGLPPHDYDREVSSIVETVNTCAKAPLGSPQATSPLCSSGFRAVPRFGAAAGGRALLFWIHAKDSGLDVNVVFRGLSGDPGPTVKPKSAAESAADIADAYRIVLAHISN